jgi:uncharacterized protein YcbX
MTATINAIYRYPVKGLSAEPLSRTRLAPGKTIAADRRYAIENGPSGFDPAAPAYLPKIRFLMLMRNERLARLDTRYDEATHVLAILTQDQTSPAASLPTKAIRTMLVAPGVPSGTPATTMMR